MIQTVVLRNVRRLLQSNNSAVVALDNSVYGLFPVPLGAQVIINLLKDIDASNYLPYSQKVSENSLFVSQIVQLTASGNFEEALALCKLLPPEDANLRTAKEWSIHIR